MNYINYFILLLVAMFGCIWVFNHVNAWAGILFAFAIGYFGLWKLITLIKEKYNEKN